MCWRTSVIAAAVAALVLTAQAAVPRAVPRGAPQFVPKLEPVAETKLLMEGLAHANFRGLERLLRQKPADAEAWTFARGQALLIAETANLLMLRPPRNKGEQLWMQRATELRSTAGQLARTLGNRDYERAREGLTTLANTCNRCHESFRVPVRIAPFATPPAPEKAGLPAHPPVRAAQVLVTD
jgi:hypothetical protein